ncbi:MAG: SdrD B-like domain-containing protein [Planctomycetota bacterium]
MVLQGWLNRLMRRERPVEQRRRSKRRRLSMQALQRRELLTADIGAISGVAFTDADGDDTYDVGVESAIEGVEVELFRDGGDGVVGGDDVSVGSLVTGVDGRYRFSNLDGADADGVTTTGLYFIVQTDAAGGPDLSDLDFGDPIPVTLSATDDDYTAAIEVDDFSTAQPAQPITQAAVGSTASSSGDLGAVSGVLGNERDLQLTVDANGGANNASFLVDTGNGQADLSTGNLVTARVLIQYDGIDADGGGATLTLDEEGLKTGGVGVRLDGSAVDDVGTVNTDEFVPVDADARLMLEISSDQAAANALNVRIYSNATDWSETTVSLPGGNVATEVPVLFSAFTQGGTATNPVDFQDIGAIELELLNGQVPVGLDFSASILRSERATETTVNLANVQEMALGGEVFFDNGGGTSTANQNDGQRDVGTEPIVTLAAGQAVTFELYELSGPAADPTTEITGASVPIATQTITGAGAADPLEYLFDTLTNGDPLGPGSYAVLIPANEFTTGQPLEGHIGSETAAADTDLNANDDNDGTFVDGLGFISGAITLVGDNEPLADGTDENTNTTVDFGVLPVVDVRVTKNLVVADSNLVAGGDAEFDIIVENLGPSEATNIDVRDFIPAGLTFNQISEGGVPFNPSQTTEVGGAMRDVRFFNIASLASGASITYRLVTDIDNNIAADPTNEVVVTPFEVEIDNDADGVVETGTENNTSTALVDVSLADLTVSKTDNLVTVTAGNQLTYQITVSNDAAADTATNVTALDTLPTGVTFSSATFTDGAGTVDETNGGANDGNVLITFGNLTAGEDETVEITVDVDPAFNEIPATLDNLVTATADNAPDVNNNDTTDVVRSTELTIDKSIIETRIPDDRTDGDDTDDLIDNAAPFAPVAGGFVTYQVTVTNDGPSQARGVEVTDTLDANLTLVAGSFSTTDGVTISQAGQDLTFTVGDLDVGVGNSKSFTFEVAIASSATAIIDNRVDTTTTDPEPDTTNNFDTISLDPTERIDLILAKTVDDNDVVAGQDSVVYTITVSHDVDSLSDAVDAVVTDTLPTGMTFVSATSGGVAVTPTQAGQQLTFPAFDLAIGDPDRVITITASVDADALGVLTNDAAVAVPNVTEITTANNTDDVDVTVTAAFDVTLTKTVVGSDQLGPADSAVFEIVVSHDTDDDGTEADNGLSPSTARDITVVDTLPAGLTFNSATVDGAAATPTQNGQVLTFADFDLNPGETRTIRVTAAVDDDSSGVLTNTAQITQTAAGETQTDNNSASDDVTITPVANVTVTKSVSATSARTGTQLTYTITVNNTGLSPAETVSVVDTLPAGVTFDSTTAAGATVNGQQITVDAGTIAAGGSFQFDILATINDGETADQVNNVSVTTTTNESSTTDNDASATTTIDQAIFELSGRIFLDFDNDGIQDAGEEGVEGVLLRVTGGDLPAAGVEGTTDANGDYLFADLVPGTYSVQRLGTPDDTQDGLEQAGTGATPEDLANETISVTLPQTDATPEQANDNNFALTPVISKRRFLASVVQTPSIQNRS